MRSTIERQGQVAAPDAVSFVPRLLVARLATAPVTEPERLRLRGAVMLSDIAGFTAHIEERSQVGRLDAVIAGFETYFAALTSAVLEHGGDIVTTAGDAFLAVWPETGDERSAVIAACRAAEAVLRATAGELSSRIGIATGDVHIDLLGGVGGRWEIVPGGRAVDGAIACESAAEPGTICLSPDAADRLGDPAAVTPGEDGRYVLISAPALDTPSAFEPAPSVPADRIRPFVPEPVVRWGAAESDWLAEFRHVTTVVGSLAELPADGAEGFHRRHELVAAFQEIARHHDAAAKVQFDGKGPACSAVFGLPPRAHADDVDRALRAAVDLSATLDRHGLTGGVGVSHGRVCCGVFGSPGRREYTLFGDAVNVASRLAAVAGREILVDGATTAAASLALELERRPALALKNRRVPAQVQRLVAVRSAAPARGRMIGRQSERELLLDAVRAVGEGQHPPPVLVRGALGIGKSTLVADVAAAARDAGHAVVVLDTQPIDQGTSYLALRPLFAPLLAGEAAV